MTTFPLRHGNPPRMSQPVIRLIEVILFPLYIAHRTWLFRSKVYADFLSFIKNGSD